MINVSQAIIDAVNGSARRIIVRATAGSETITVSQIKSVTVARGACGTQPLSGSMFIPSVEVEFFGSLSSADVGDALQLDFRLDSYAWTQLGAYIISNVASANGVTKISAIGTLSTVGAQTATISHTAIADVISDVETGTGVTVRLQGVTATGSLTETPTGTWRSVMQEVAIALGGFLTEDNAGQWTIAKFCSGSTVSVAADRSQKVPDYEQTYTLESRTVESGTIEMTMGNPLIDPWDILSITDLEGNTHLLPCLKITHKFHGGLETTVEAIVETAIQEEAKIEGPVNGVVQHFWFDGAGAHVTQVTKQDYIDDPSGAGGNSLITSNGMQVRDGTEVLAEFASDGIQMKNATGLSVLDIDSASNLTSIHITEGPLADEQGGQQHILSNNPMTDTVIVMFVVIDATREIFNCTAGTAYTTSGSVTTADTDYTLTYDGNRTFNLTLSNASVYCFFQYIYYDTYSYQPILTYGTSKGLRGGFSATLGEGLEAPSDNQVAVGMYNDAIGSDFFEVGVGTDDNNRKTMFAVSGDGMYGGGMYESSIGISNMEAGFNAVRTDTGRKMAYIIGSGGNNAGVYDRNNDRWLIAANTAGATIIAGNTVTDFVVQQGTSGIWTYRKWSSGVGECWGRWTKSNIASSTKWNNIYYGSLGRPSNYPFTFTAYPTVELTLQSSNGTGWGVFSNSDYSTTNAGTVYLATANSTSSTNVTVNIHALGRWK